MATKKTTVKPAKVKVWYVARRYTSFLNLLPREEWVEDANDYADAVSKANNLNKGEQPDYWHVVRSKWV